MRPRNPIEILLYIAATIALPICAVLFAIVKIKAAKIRKARMLEMQQQQNQA